MKRKHVVCLTLLGVIVAGISLSCSDSRSHYTAADSTATALMQVGRREKAMKVVALPARPPVAAGVVSGLARNELADAITDAAAEKRVTLAEQVPQGQVVPSSMLIKQGTASVQVDSLDTAIARVRGIAQRVGAIVANTEMQTGKDELHSASIELRVPSDRFDEAVSGLTPLGKVESVNVTVEDVGEEYVDVNARVANAHRLEERLIDLLARRTGKLSDVLAVERELARVREQIERYEGRLRYLRTRASVSTLTVTVHEPAPIVSPIGQSPIREALKQAWRNFVDVISTLIASLGVLIPLGVLLGGLVWVGRKHLPWSGKAAQPTV
jgi:acetolactate synthase regulatory subunit